MCGRFLLLLIAIPVVELGLLIEVGTQIGVLSTIWLVGLTAAVGLFFVRQQGVAVLKKLQTPGVNISAQMLEGPLLALAALCLLIPGFVTDSLGAFLLIPPLRSAVARAWSARIQSRVGQGGGIRFTMHDFGQSPFDRPPGSPQFDLRGGDDEETVVTIVEKEPEVPIALPGPTDPESDTQ